MPDTDSTPSQTSVTTRSNPPRLGEALVERRLITEAQLQEALAFQRKKGSRKLLGQILIERGLVSPEDVTAALAEMVGIPFATINASLVQAEALQTLPREFLQKHNILPLSVQEDWLTVATADFTDVFLIEDIARQAKRRVQVVAATPENIRQVRRWFTSDIAPPNSGLDAAIRNGEETRQDAEDEDLTVIAEPEPDAQVTDLEVAAADSPIVKLVNRIIRGAVQARASDIHIEPDHGINRVRYRVDGQLELAMRISPAAIPAVASRIKIMARMDISERRAPQDGQITVMLDGRPIELRVSTIPTRFGEKVVMRVIDERAALFDLNQLGLSDATLATWRLALGEPNGVVLTTGPTGSGKSTTLYASLLALCNDAKNICTVEDPIEHNLVGVNQFEIAPRAGFTFPQALRALVRQDPNVIMVGEIRDTDTAKLAIEAALTGHLVLSTLHTNDAVSTVTRLVNMGVEAYLVAAAVRCVLAQRLVRRLCPHCRHAVELGPSGHAILIELLGDAAVPDHVYAASGCPRCRNTGYAGRIGIYEILQMDESLAGAIARGCDVQQLRKLAKERGHVTLRHDGVRKVVEGQISFEALIEGIGRVAASEMPTSLPSLELTDAASTESRADTN